MKYISHINKLRNGSSFEQLLVSGHIFVTETSSVLILSKSIARQNHSCDYATKISLLTNLLWYYKCQGFGGSFPANANVAIQARTVLSRIIDTNVSQQYKDAFDSDYAPEKVDYYITYLHEIKELPEELDGVDCVNSLAKSKVSIDEFYKRIESEREKHLKTSSELTNQKSRNAILENDNRELADTVKRLTIENENIKTKKERVEENERVSSKELKKAKRQRLILLIILFSFVFFFVLDKIGLTTKVSHLVSKNWGLILGYFVNFVLSIIASLVASFIIEKIRILWNRRKTRD